MHRTLLTITAALATATIGTIHAQAQASTQPMAVTATLSAPTVAYLRPDTVSGMVAAGSVPVARAEVDVYENNVDGEQFALQGSTRTDASGHYSFQLNPLVTTKVTVVAHTRSQTANVVLPVTVTMPATITGFTASVGGRGTVSVSGCIDGNYELDVPLGYLHIQYATAPGGPWHSLPSSIHETATCPGTAFYGTARAPLTRAYYRVGYTGGKQDGTTYLPSTSKAILAG
jgi:hypothetical protein